MDLNHQQKNTLRRVTVYLKYLFPAICVAFVWLFSSLNIWKFSNGDGTDRVYQSLITLINTVKSSSDATLAMSDASTSDVALAKSLLPAYWIFWSVLWAVTVLAIILCVFSLLALTKQPESSECNRLKVWFRCIFPGRAVHFLLPTVSSVPLFLPYYIVDRFTKYYSAKSVAEGDVGTAVEYYEYSVTTAGPNPVVILSVLVIAALIIFVVAIPFERSQKLDMYTNFEK